MTVADQTLFTRLGGGLGIKAVVTDLYDRMLADPRLGPYFDRTDMQTQRAHVVALLSQVSGGPVQYSGRAMNEAHAGLHITDEQFDATVDHIVAALSTAGVPDDAIDEVGQALLPLRSEIVSK